MFLQINPLLQKKREKFNKKNSGKTQWRTPEDQTISRKKVINKTPKQIRYCQVQLYCAVNVLESVKAVAGMAVEAVDPV